MHLSTRGSTRRRSRRRPPVLVRPWERSVERERRRAFYRARTDPDPGRQLLLPEHAPPPGGEFLHPTRRNSRPVAPGLWVGSPLALANEAGEFDVVVDVTGRSIKPVPVTGRSIPPDLVVFEYRRASRTQPWAYLVMFDPTWERASWATLTPLTRGAPARVTEVALEPSTDTPETTLVTGGPDVFQLEDPASLTYPAPTSPSTVTVRWTGWPRLFLSHDPVTWRLDDEGSWAPAAARSGRLAP